MARTKRRTILGKIESTYGVDPVPTGAANAILVSDLSLTPLNADYVARNLIKLTRGTDGQLVTNEHVQVDFAVEAAGAGAVDTAPAFGPLLRGCGLAETINATTSVEYDPVSSGDESVAFYVNHDGERHPILGARGTVSFSLERNQVPSFRFSFTGLHVAPSAQALPTPTFTGFKDPLPANDTNTPTFTLHGLAGILSSLSFDLGNQVQLRKMIGAETVELIDRAVTGQVTIERPGIATKDFFAIAKAGTTGALQVVHGTAAGGIVQVDAPAVQLTNPQLVDLDGIEGLQMDMALNRSSGDDELQITTK